MTMKKLFSAVCISTVLLTGCSSGPSKGDQMYEKYGKLIDALEAGNYEESLKAFMEYVPQPETEEVTLTKDNLYDYFELVVEPRFEKDAHGNVKSVLEFYRLKLKPELGNNVSLTGGTVGYEYQFKCYRITEMNAADGTYQCEETELPSSISYASHYLEPQSKSSDLTSFGASLCGFDYENVLAEGGGMGGSLLPFEEPEKYTDHYVLKPDTINIVNVTGTLTIRK